MNGLRSVAVVGDNCLDHYLGSPEHTHVGGNAVNVAIQLSRLGASVSYFGAVGDDDAGRLIRRTLEAMDVDTEGLQVLPGPTAVTTIRVHDDGDREFVQEDFGVTSDYRPRPKEIDAIAAADWAHIGMLHEATLLRSALAGRGVTVSQDCAVAEGFADLDVAFLSAGEAGEDPALVQTASAAGVPTIIVTLGSHGSVAHHGSSTWTQDAVPTRVVDTTGAGDSFIAGFIADRLDQRPIRTALLSGSRLAAVTCSHFGGWPSDDPRSKEHP